MLFTGKQLTVHIPDVQSDSFAYSLYAVGYRLYTGASNQQSSGHVFRFKGETPSILFYTFTGFKRAFVVTAWNGVGEKKHLPGIDEPVRVLYTARDRQFRTLNIYVKLLTAGDETEIFRMPLSFWYRLTYLIQYKKDMRKSDVLNLYWQFGGKKNYRELGVG